MGEYSKGIKMTDRIYVLMATIPEREAVLEKVLKPLYDKVDEIRIVFNNYQKIPDWIFTYKKIKPLLNTPDKYTSNAVWLLIKDIEGYVFTCDDDILYPDNYVEHLVQKMKEYNNETVLTLYGEIAKRPFIDYCPGRYAIGFFRAEEKDTPVDITGVGCSVFHTSMIKPSIEDFPDMYSRDIWFSIFVHKRKMPIIRIKSEERWVNFCKTEGSPEITWIWRKDPKLTERRKEVYKNILCPLLDKDKPREYSKQKQSLTDTSKIEEINYAQWKKDNAKERLITFSHLTEKSLVWEIGLWEGKWTDIIIAKYNPNIFAFEPIAKWNKNGKQKYKDNKKVCVFPFGLGKVSEIRQIGVDKDASGLFCNSASKEEIEIRSISSFFQEREIQEIDLVQCNCEGSEYDIIPELIEKSLINRIRNIQIQFHNIEKDSYKKMKEIRSMLSKTHIQKYSYDFVWELWERKNA